MKTIYFAGNQPLDSNAKIILPVFTEPPPLLYNLAEKTEKNMEKTFRWLKVCTPWTREHIQELEGVFCGPV